MDSRPPKSYPEYIPGYPHLGVHLGGPKTMYFGSRWIWRLRHPEALPLRIWKRGLCSFSRKVGRFEVQILEVNFSPNPFFGRLNCVNAIKGRQSWNTNRREAALPAVPWSGVSDRWTNPYNRARFPDYVRSTRQTPSNYIQSYYIIFDHIISYSNILYYIILYSIILYYIRSYYILFDHII